MSELGTYTFLPWLRQGIANEISGQSGIRATIPVDLTLSGEKTDGGVATRPPIQKAIEIYGPGDIVGIDKKAIVKAEPANWITNFEPNYLPYIEFYDEDFPWRYSPVTSENHRLLPWIMLVVLKENEFKDGKNIKDRPLPYILPNGEAKLPPSDQLWAWAHVHVNKNLIGADFISTNAGSIQTNLANTLKADPDEAYSRIMCPRRLEDKTAYHAFLVPAFESGRLAGLGQDPASAGAHDTPAWSNGVLPAELPYYHRWYFRTGNVGDFEYLVRLLKPQPVDSRVGLRDMDVQKPGANIKGIIDAPDATDEQKLGGILKLEGALKIPDIYYTPEEFAIITKYRNWATLNNTQPYPHPFQESLAAFINLTDNYEVKSAQQANAEANIQEDKIAVDPATEYDIAQNPDPLITAPLYGRWHSLTQRLLTSRDGSPASPNANWVHELNLDPRWRVSAGFGTKIVQENQEDYMKSAWEQIGEVLEANKKIRQAQLALEVSWVWHQTHLKTAKEKSSEKWLTLAAPLQKRVINEGFTIYHQVNQSKIPQAAFSAPMRKLMRPRGNFVKRLSFDENISVNNLLDRLNSGVVTAAPPRTTPEGIVTVKDMSDQLKPKNLHGFVKKLIDRHPHLKWYALILAAVILLLLIIFNPGGALYTLGIGAIIALVFIFRQISNWGKRLEGADAVLEENQTPESIDDIRKSPDFRISLPGENFTPSQGNTDSEEAKRFKTALKDTHGIIQESATLGATPEKPELNMTAVSEKFFESLHPDLTIPKWTWNGVLIPGRIRELLKEKFVEAMAYPEINLPMYKPLTQYAADLFLPNINFIAQNSISLLETNQKFIESYMVGLNHEFARELLWREYPTDQRGSYFRQFWEAANYHDGKPLSAEELKEKLKDIPPLHLWSKFSNLGDHDHREQGGDNEEEVVLVIRGELLKKYPNAIIYAHKAVWKDSDGNPVADGNHDAIDVTKERDLRPLTAQEEANPPRSIIKSPLYEAKVSPDIYFFGFDLTTCEAMGGTGKESDAVDERCAQEGIAWHDPGWFFVIKERPGEPRFGLDIGGEKSAVEDGKVEVWNDLSWDDITPAVEVGGFIQITAQTQSITASQSLESNDDEKITQQEEDEHIAWNKNMSSAELAYILYQVPVMVAVHASEMLPED